MTYYKATRPDGTDFRTGTIDYAAALVSGKAIEHPNPHREDASGYLSVSVSAADCTGFSWPCRLFEVEPVGETWAPNSTELPSKVACRSLGMVHELPAHEAFGPQGEQVVALIERAKTLTTGEARAIDAAIDAARGAAWDAAWYAAWDAAWYAARCAAWDAAGDAAWDAAWYAARALVVRDLIGTHGFTQEHYDALTGPWRKVVGPIHPGDAPMEG